MLKSHRLTLFFIVGVMLVAIWGCAENNPNTTPEVYAPVYPDSLYRNSGPFYVGVTVRDPQGLLDINLVEFRIAHPATADTGRWVEIVDGGSNGDALAGDGIYGTLVQEFGANAPSGGYVLYFRAFDNDNHNSNTLQQSMVLREDNIPLILTPALSDSVFADVVDTLTDSLQVRVTVSHPDSSASINEVWFEIYDPSETGGETSYDMFDDGVTGGDSTAGDGRYALKIPVTAVVRDSLQGFFRFEFNANDNRGASALPVDKYLFVLNNDKPELLSLIAPDTMSASSQDTLPVFLTVTDPQGLGDIDSVWFQSYRPDGSSSGSRFYLLDNGEGADSTASDGVYSVGIRSFGASPTGLWTFRFYARDLQGALSDSLDHPILIND